MRYRKLDSNDDYSFGHGLSDFWIDVPDAVAQSVSTRLQLQTGTWFLDTTEGIDWKTKVLGRYTGDTRDPVIRARILATTGVTEITDYSSALDRETRKFSVTATITTDYGQAKVSETL
ncbi:hypothetical protein [Allorhizobium ampelinum]|uniref:hypothetical protein n=1 Tax=Allorhizobium ampelinum TaxID=3025782 RepID=UPI000B402341|nr:hypothetical protein [Allorhizobium ampelinum]NTA27389.1 hypothetical protein [Allorhizobium ampelinum]OVE94444.1 hypothetical protein B7W85_12905 [Allorhizobium ampelinum]